MSVNARQLTESLEKKYSLKESYWWEDWENLPEERTDEISRWAKSYVDEICKYDLRNYDIVGPKFEDSNEKFTVIINNMIFDFDWADVWVNKAFYDESREETLPDDYEPIYDFIDGDPIGYRIINTIESTKADDYSDGKLNESYVEEWWGQTEEDPFDFANEYNLRCEPLKYNRDEVLYRFTGTSKDIERAKSNGYFYSTDYVKDECYSKKPMTEDYEDARDTDVYEQVFTWVQNKLDDFTSQIPVQDLAIEIKGYDPDWCAQDMSDYSMRAFEKALHNFAKALTDTYFEYYDEY